MKIKLYFPGGVKVYSEKEDKYLEMPHDYRLEIEVDAVPREGEWICFHYADHVSLSDVESFRVDDVTHYVADDGDVCIQLYLTPEGE